MSQGWKKGLLFGGIIIGIILLVLASLNWQYVYEWADANLLTVSTKEKQMKYLEFAQGRADALEKNLNSKDLARYQAYLDRAEGMAEVILFLDGAELPVMENVEKVTRSQEIELRQALSHDDLNQAIELEAVSTARIENRTAFEYMVENYQFNDADIQKYGDIVREHIELIQDSDNPEIQQLIAEAEDHLNSGLNLRAYELVDQAKSIYYSNF